MKIAGTINRLAGSLFAAATLCLGAYGQNQSALDAAGIQAQRLEHLWWVFFYICVGVYVIVLTVLLAALFKRKTSNGDISPDVRPDQAREKQAGLVVKGAVGMTAVIILALMIMSFQTGRAIGSQQYAPQPLTLKITGSQWWWSVEYVDNEDPSNNIRTANELHLPMGRPVQIAFTSTDVIHSFWVPNLHGKIDLIPNYPTTFFFRPDKEGIYFGQCAEFCGYQHAKMRFTVYVHSQVDFDAWANAQRQTPAAPAYSALQRGQQIFLTSTCTQCHAVQGTPANGSVGPNLTHVASRRYIAAGSLQNTNENLRKWITDPQAIKPGNRMPMHTYSNEDLTSLVTYIESLK
jgi:cytochrome c oxidase subunit 2